MSRGKAPSPQRWGIGSSQQSCHSTVPKWLPRGTSAGKFHPGVFAGSEATGKSFLIKRQKDTHKIREKLGRSEISQKSTMAWGLFSVDTPKTKRQCQEVLPAGRPPLLTAAQVMTGHNQDKKQPGNSRDLRQKKSLYSPRQKWHSQKEI